MKKIFNFRIVFILAISMLVAILFATFVFVAEKSKLIVMIVLFSTCFVLIILFLIFKKKFVVIMAAVLLFAALPFLSLYSKSVKLNNNSSINVENAVIYGKIYNKNENLDDGYVKLYLSDVEVIDENKTYDVYGNILVRVNANNFDLAECLIGRYIYISGDINFYTLQELDSKYALTNISNGNVGYCYCFSFNVSFSDEFDLSFKDKFRNSVFEKFSEKDSKFANIGYAMMFGESSVLNEDVKSVFLNTGIAHLLAVSGFHISLVVLALSFILNKLKANRYVKFGIITVFLVFYAYICAFSPSVIRACVMAIIALYATSRTKEYDSLNALALAFILILLINPVELFKVSFVLSFTSTFSIVCLKPILDRFFDKFLYKKFASLLSITLAVQIGLFVTQLYYFNQIPLLSFVSNLITVPVASVLFILVFMSVLLSFVLPFMTIFIDLFSVIMKILVQFNNWIAGMSISVSASQFAPYVLLLSLIAIFFASDYVFVEKKKKIIISLSSFVALAILVII